MTLLELMKKYDEDKQELIRDLVLDVHEDEFFLHDVEVVPKMSEDDSPLLLVHALEETFILLDPCKWWMPREGSAGYAQHLLDWKPSLAESVWSGDFDFE
jgi:hypothetical protein